MTTDVLSYSRIVTFLKCRQQYSYRYIDRLKPRVRQLYLQRGTLIHKGLEAALRTAHQKEYSKVFTNAEAAIHESFSTWIERPEVIFLRENPEEVKKQEELLEDSISIAKRGIENIDIHKGRWDTLSLAGKPLIEYQIEVPLPPWKGFVGIVDWVATDTHTGLSWLLDFKTRENLTSDEDEEINLQFSVYQYLLMRENIFLNGTATYQIRAVVPDKPRLLQNGKLSRAKICCDWKTYLQCIKEYNLDPSEYEDMKDKLSTLEKFSTNYRTFEEVENTWKVIQDISKDMTHSPLQIYRNLNAWNCRGCSYKTLCHESLRGKNVDDILSNDFI